MRNVKVTQSVFNCVKTLLAGGASHQECADYMKLSIMTVGRINRAETYEDYKHTIIMASLHSGKPVSVPVPEPEQTPEPKEEKPEKPKTVDVSGTYQMNRLIELMKEQNELLKTISNKMAFIVEQLS